MAFNYTASLTNIYGVERFRIVHVHGDASAANAEIILGHAWTPTPRVPSEEDDPRVAEGYLSIEQYFVDTFKPTSQILTAHRSFFKGLHGSQLVFVMSHRIGDVDFPYFAEVVRHIGAANARWRISYYCDTDISHLRQQIRKLNIPDDLVEFVHLADI